MMERRLWTPEEDQVIMSLVSEHGKKKWALIADQMHKVNPISHRTSKQIRQRWHNHLDPEVNKQPWTPQQEKILFDAHRRYGNKWKEIAAQLQRRTDNYVKNHFYSTLRRSLRRINKYLGFKNSTNQMRTIRPSILSYLLDLSDNDPECRILVTRIFEFSQSKPNKNSSQELIDDTDKHKFQSAISKLLQINQIYTQYRNRKTGKNEIKIQKTNSNLSQKLAIEDKNEPSTEKYVDYEGEEQSCENGMDGSWQNESPINQHYKLLPDIQVPDYGCQLLDREVDENELMDYECQFKTTETINLFNL